MLKEEKILVTTDNDCFGLLEKVSIIKKFLIDNYDGEILKGNNMIAIYGDWGSGKSSLLKTLKNQLDKEDSKYEILQFDTWKYENTDNLAYTLFEFIVENLKSNSKEQLLENGRDILVGIAKGVKFDLGMKGLININYDPSKVFDELEKRENKRNTFYKKEKDYNDKFKTAISEFVELEKKKIIVFVDDLDRCDSEKILKLLSALKYFLAIDDNIIFICTIDNKAVQSSLSTIYGNDENKSKEFLEKIFPINFSMPKKEKMISKFVELYDCPKSKVLSDFFSSVKFTNPRKIKRIMNKYETMRKNIKSIETDFDEILFAYLLILKQNYEPDFDAILNDRKNICLGANNITFYAENKKVRWWDNLNKIVYMFDDKHTNVFPIVEVLTPISLKNIEISCSSLISNNTIAYIKLHAWLNELGDGFFHETMRFLLHDYQINKNTYFKEEMDYYKLDWKSIGSFIKNKITDLSIEIDMNF